MGVENLSNPIEAVYLISVYSYFNSLSDFLYKEYYLSTSDRHKQVPVVNALYDYLDKNKDDQTDLIRSLLRNSDLYGEKIGETFDDTFVNAMFDYIISSLVFDKYGNIYGFLTDVVRKSDNLEIDDLFKRIKNTLKNAKFENVYGDRSSLTSLAADRIFTDLILPLFPKPKGNLTLLSLDYIYAQTGSILLRHGRQNATYYWSMLTERIELNEKTLFDEYLLIGHLIEELIIDGKLGQLNATAFALPALFVYVNKEKENLERVKITDIIFNSDHWLRVYNSFFTHLNRTYDKIENFLKIDTKYNLHFVLSGFKSYATMALFLIDNDIICKVRSESYRMRRVPDYENNPEFFGCTATEHHLPNLNEFFTYQVNDIVNAYKKIEYESITKEFENYFPKSIRGTEAVIKLLNNSLSARARKNPIRRSYDFFKIYYFSNASTNLYVIRRQNYSVQVIAKNDDPELFRKIMPSFDETLGESLPFSDQLNDIRDEIVKKRSYKLNLFLLTTIQAESHDDWWESQKDWWKEYGFSLVPHYPCLSHRIVYEEIDKRDLCKIDTFINMYPVDQKYDNISVHLTQKKTQDFLTSIGTTIKTLSFKNLLKQTIKKEKDPIKIFFEHFPQYEGISEFVTTALESGKNKLLSLSNPKYNLVFQRNTTMDIIFDSVAYLQTFTSWDYNSTFHMIGNIRNFLHDHSALVTGHSDYPHLDVNVMSQYEYGDSGYGYKFVHLHNDKVARLRTVRTFDTEETVLLLTVQFVSVNEKKYRKINSTTLTPINQYLFEIDGKLQYNSFKLRFKSIVKAEFNLFKCNYDHNFPPVMIDKCPRILNEEIQEAIEDEIIHQALNAIPLPKNELLKVISNYVFPDENFNVTEFVFNWSLSLLSDPEFAKKYVIERKNDLFDLRYKEWLDSTTISAEDATSRINRIYRPKERIEIEEKETLERILKNYKSSSEHFSATFEDYYAVRNYASIGYTRITGDTNEAKRMKIALYKLAIRQSDDPVKDFDLVLNTMESVPFKSLERLFPSGTEYTLEKFTMMTKGYGPSALTTISKKEGFAKVLLQMTFSKPYFRVKLNQMFSATQSKTILLPGSKFLIQEAYYTGDSVFGQYYLVEMKYIHKDNEKYEWYQKIMNAISKIKL